MKNKIIDRIIKNEIIEISKKFQELSTAFKQQNTMKIETNKVHFRGSKEWEEMCNLQYKGNISVYYTDNWGEIDAVTRTTPFVPDKEDFAFAIIEKPKTPKEKIIEELKSLKDRHSDGVWRRAVESSEWIVNKHLPE